MEIGTKFKLEAQEDFLKNLEYLLSVFPDFLDIVRCRSKPVQCMVYNEVIMKIICDFRSIKCISKLCEINNQNIQSLFPPQLPTHQGNKYSQNQTMILSVECAYPLLIMSPNEDLKNIWNLIEKMFELNNDILLLGFRKIFQFRELSKGYDSSIIKRFICRKANIQNLSNKFDQLFQQLEQRLVQLWRYILPIGQTVYLQEFNEEGQDNSTQDMSVQYNEQQILELVKVSFKIYHHNGNKKDEDGRYFQQHAIDSQQQYQDEWVNVQSQKLIPISTFETYQGNLELVKFLTEQIHSLDFDFSDPNLPSIQCQYVKDRINLALGTPLYNACENGRLDVAKYLIQFKWQIDYRTYYDVSPLMIALQNDHLDIAELLIRRGASLNIDSRFSRNQKRKEEMQEKLNIVNYQRLMQILYLKSNPTQNSDINVFFQMSKSVFEKIIKEY
eukprot:403340892